MSNNKSRKLSRKAGGHTVFQASSGIAVSPEDFRPQALMINDIVRRTEPDTPLGEDETIKSFVKIAEAVARQSERAKEIATKSGHSLADIERLFARFKQHQGRDLETVLRGLFNSSSW
ncbi:MAG: hypothetical protein L6414_09960 [Hydrogenophaga sp.]|uniref:hypothetical protein n=1 Tax=Hydrogenophaga sp. TaxID=1904254 RepID=UPI0025C3A146|nr:hypothetical protein [Hydrogenophaga sp.]MCG2655772.1 hypothetical protein [Hydrogenophaga sp.]